MADLAKGRHTATRFALGAALGVLVLCDQLIFNIFFTNPF